MRWTDAVYMGNQRYPGTSRNGFACHGARMWDEDRIKLINHQCHLRAAGLALRRSPKVMS